MKVLVLEDDDGKFLALSSALLSFGITSENILRCRVLSELTAVPVRSIDICIVDLWMPFLIDGEPRDASGEIIAMLEGQGGFSIPVIVITDHFGEASIHIEKFAKKGCPILDYRSPDIWKSALRVTIGLAKDRHRYHFIVFVALESERNAYAKVPGLNIRVERRGGLDIWEVQMGGLLGAIVCLPRMGLVNAAAITARVLENYTPEFACMSGICAGIGSNAELGQLLITDICWEYQSGKWHEDGFQSEPYQVEIHNSLRSDIRLILAEKGLLDELETGLADPVRPKLLSIPKLAIFTSGSAVIAKDDIIKQVANQHRKVAGMDMEIYGFHRAVHLSGLPIRHFSAKVVVDKADKRKSDALHSYGCYVSARFCLETIRRLSGEHRQLS